MWEAIAYVSSGVTLAAFLAAVAAWSYRHRIKYKEKLIEAVPENERATLVQQTLEFFHVETSGLTKQQQYDLALRQIESKNRRFRLSAALVFALAVLGGVVSGYAIYRIDGQATDEQSTQESDKLYIARLIDPPGSESAPTLSTVSIASTGTLSYDIHSVEITHIEGGCSSMASGAVPPDANYEFQFRYGSHDIHPLNPSLHVSGNDQRAVHFTLGLAPQGSFPSVCGRVNVHLHYVGSDGSKGTLPLDQRRVDVAFLARTLNRAVYLAENSQLSVVQPNGDITSDALSKSRAVSYDPLHFHTILPSFNEYLQAPRSNKVIGKSRELLQQAILESEGALDSILHEVSFGRDFAVDLCATLPDAQCETALLELIDNTESEHKAILAFYALAIRHVISPSRVLADSLTKKGAVLEGSAHIKNLIGALIAYPSGEWKKALFNLAPHHQIARKALYVMRDSLSNKELDHLARIYSYTIKENQEGWSERADVDDLLRLYVFLYSPKELEGALHEALSENRRLRYFVGGQVLANYLGIGLSISSASFYSNKISVWPQASKDRPGHIEIYITDDNDVDVNTDFEYMINQGKYTHRGLSDYVDITNSHPLSKQKLGELRELIVDLDHVSEIMIPILVSKDRDGKNQKLLIESISHPVKANLALRTLAQRHLIEPTGVLAQATEAYLSTSQDGGFSELTFFALLLKRGENWDTAAIKLAEREPWGNSAMVALYEVRNDIGQTGRKLLRQQLEKIFTDNEIPVPAVKLIRLALWAGIQPEFFWKRLETWESGLEEGDTYTQRALEEIRQIVK